MEVNPSKFQVLISEENTIIKLKDNCTIEREPDRKVLGVHPDMNFTFDHHISIGAYQKSWNAIKLPQMDSTLP